MKNTGTLKVETRGDREIVMTRVFDAPRELVFKALTTPELLKRWFGPHGWTLTECEVDLRVGGSIRIVNAIPGGGVVTIHGEFRVVDPPHKLVYTWRMDDGAGESSLVTVTFEPRGDATEVVVVHEDIPSEPVRESHESGWRGCLDGLERAFTTP